MEKFDSKMHFLRKLDNKEIGLIKRGWGQNMVMKLRVKSMIDHFASPSVLKKSINLWRQSQKFLRAKISKIGSNEYILEYTNDNNHFDNVKLLRAVETNSQRSDRERVSQLLFDYIVSNEIDPDKDDSSPLWYLYVFELDCKVYDLIAIFHHSITQGKTGYLNLCELLKTIEKVHKNEPVDLKEGDVFPGCESLFDFALSSNSSMVSAMSTPVVKVPSFVNPQNAKANSINSFKSVDFESEIEYVDSGKRFEATIDDLVRISRLNFIKYEEFVLGIILI